MINIKKIIPLFLLISSLGFSSAAEKEAVLVDEGHYDCLPVYIFGLDEIILSHTVNDVIRILGEPKEIGTSWGEDDGGRHDTLIYHYDGLSIDIVRGELDRIYTSSPKAQTPSGIRVGQSRDEVVEILGRAPRGWQGEESKFTIPNCQVNGVDLRRDYLELEFDDEGALLSIVYLVDRP